MCPASQVHICATQGHGPSPMAGVDGDAAASSVIVQQLAKQLQCNSSTAECLPVLQAISAAIDQLLPRLPPSFLEPVLPPGSLNDNQVGNHATVLHLQLSGM